VQEKPGRPIQWLAEQLGLDPTQISGRRTEARREGFLITPGTSGKPGGVLTEKSRELLLEAGVDVDRDDPQTVYQSMGQTEPDEQDADSHEEWVRNLSPDTVYVLHRLVALVTSIAPYHHLQYERSRVYLFHPLGPSKFVAFSDRWWPGLKPKPDQLILELRLPWSDALSAQLEQSGLNFAYDVTLEAGYRVYVDRTTIARNEDLIVSLMKAAFAHNAVAEHSLGPHVQGVSGLELWEWGIGLPLGDSNG
jgi:hypothetical protein